MAIQKFVPCYPCFKVLPLVYDESLSYYEVLCKLTYKVNEIIAEIENDNSAIYDYINQQDMATLENAKKYTDDEIMKVNLELSNSMSVLLSLITSKNNETKAYVVSEINALKDWMEKQGCTVYVTNPITGGLDSIQGVLDSFYNYFNYGGLTCLEYDALGLTADEYDSKKLTCDMYDRQGKKYLVKDEVLYMFNPVTGVRQLYKYVIDYLVQLHRERGVTCSQYDTENVTTENYDLFGMSAYNYDWFASDYLQLT